jgi:hypothetical protein
MMDLTPVTLISLSAARLPSLPLSRSRIGTARGHAGGREREAWQARRGRLRGMFRFHFLAFWRAVGLLRQT